MKNSPFLIGAAIILAICFAIASRAGDLNPPDGPVAPSMHTIDDLFSAVTLSNPNRPWRSTVVNLTQPSSGSCIPTEVPVLPEGVSGVLHAVLASPTGFPFECLESDAGASPLCVIESFYLGNGPTVTNVIPLNIQFTNGLRVRSIGCNSQSTRITFIYREDTVVSPPRP